MLALLSARSKTHLTTCALQAEHGYLPSHFICFCLQYWQANVVLFLPVRVVFVGTVLLLDSVVLGLEGPWIGVFGGKGLLDGWNGLIWGSISCLCNRLLGGRNGYARGCVTLFIKSLNGGRTGVDRKLIDLDDASKWGGNWMGREVCWNKDLGGISGVRTGVGGGEGEEKWVS